MVPQNDYTLKHNSLTKSSSWRGAHWLLAYGKYEQPPNYSSKPKANEVWRFENSHCGGRAVPIPPSDVVCLSSPFLRTVSENIKPCNSNPEIANAGAAQTTSTSSPLMCASFPASASVLPWSPLTKSCSRTSSEFPDSPCPSTQHISLQGHMEVERNGKMSSGRTYYWLRSCLRWSDLLMQDHTFLRHSMNSKAW